MFGIASRYVKAKINAPAFNIICKYYPIYNTKKTQYIVPFLVLNVQGKSPAISIYIARRYAEQSTR